MLFKSPKIKIIILAVIITITVVFLISSTWQKPLWENDNWKTNTINKVESTFRYYNKNAGAYAELPSLSIQETPDLYSTVWIIKTLSLIDFSRTEQNKQKIVKWLQSLQQKNGLYSYPNNPGLPDLYVAYLTIEGLYALGAKPANSNSLGVAIANLQDSNGLFSWDKKTAPDYAATETACQILASIGITKNTTATKRSLSVAFAKDDLFSDSDLTEFLNIGAPIINALQSLGVDSSSFPKELIDNRVHWLDKIEEEFFQHASTSGPSLSTLQALIKAKHFFGMDVTPKDSYIKLLMDSQLDNGGFSAMDNYQIDPQATFEVAEILSYWKQEFPQREALINTLELNHSQDGGWISQVAAPPNPKSTYYALSIFNSMNAKPTYATEIDLCIKEWLNKLYDNSKSISLSEQLAKNEYLYYTLKCAELRKIDVDTKKINDTLVQNANMEIWDNSQTPLSVIVHFVELYCKYQGILPDRLVEKFTKRVNEILKYKITNSESRLNPEVILNLLKLSQALNNGKLEDKSLHTALGLMQPFSVSTKANTANILAIYYAYEAYAIANEQLNNDDIKGFLSSAVNPSGGFYLYPHGKVETNDLTLETTYMGIILTRTALDRK